MEGDIKDIVLARLEKRLKDKDEEIRALKDRVRNYEDSDRISAIEKKAEHLEDELRETQTTLSEVMKMMGSLEAVLTSLVAAGEEDDGAESFSDPDLALDGQSEPAPQEPYDIGVGASPDPAANGVGKKDALSFFRMNQNT